MKTNAVILIFSLAVLMKPLSASCEPPEIGISLKSINKFIQDSPNDPNLYFVKGLILLEKKRFRKAKREFETTLELFPTYYEAYYELAKVQMHMGKFNSAMEYIVVFLKNNPGDIEGMILKGDIYLALEDYPQAIEVIDQVLNTTKNNKKAHLIKGTASFELKDYDSAHYNWLRAYELGDKSAGLHLRYLLRPVW